MRRIVALGALAAVSFAGTASAQQQAGGQVQVGPLGLEFRVIPIDLRFNHTVNFGMTLNPNNGQLSPFVASPTTPLMAGPFCAPTFGPTTPPPPPPSQPPILCMPTWGYTATFGPGRDTIRFMPSFFPAQPPPQPQGQLNLGAGNDNAQGGNADEKIDAGKGDDNVNPGDGKDKANLGPGNDKANARDGEPDKVNGGSGKDEAKVDDKDKVKNVEVVKRK